MRGKVRVFIDLRAAEGLIDWVQFSRHFAVRELRTFVVLLLMRYTLEIDPTCGERPTFMWERMGVGVMPPRGDLRVILHARK